MGKGWSMFINVSNPASFLFIFSLSNQIVITIWEQIYVKNVHPVFGAWILSHDLLIRYESPPLTTRPGLPPKVGKCLHTYFGEQIGHTIFIMNMIS